MGGWAALAQGVSSIGETTANYFQTKAAQKRAYKLGQKALKEGPANARYGMEQAGFNPLLALGPPSSAQAVGGSALPAGKANPAGAISAAAASKQASLKGKLNNAQISALENQANRDASASYQAMQNGVYFRDLAAGQRIENVLKQTQVPSAKAVEELYNEYPLLRAAKEVLGGGLGTVVKPR